MTREWKFVNYPDYEQQILDVVPDGEKGVHQSGAEFFIFSGSRDGIKLKYIFGELTLELSLYGTSENGESIFPDTPEAMGTLGPYCKMSVLGNPLKDENFKMFKPDDFQVLIDLLCSFLAEFHHSAKDLRYPKGNKYTVIRKAIIKKLFIWEPHAKRMGIEKLVYDIGSSEQ